LLKLKLVFFLFLISLTSLRAQVTTEGKDFWFGFMQNADGGSSSSNMSTLEIFITSNEPASGQIINYTDGAVVNFTIVPGATFKNVLSVANNNPYAASGSGNAQSKGIHITSDVDISVYAFNRRRFSADASVILPTNSLGNKYYASGYYETYTDGYYPGYYSELLVVATTDDTEIEITPSVDTENGFDAGQTYSVTLNAGDIYQLQAVDDLTGTLINASTNANDCKNFAVFSGHQFTRVNGGQNCDYSTTNNNGAITNYSDGFAADHLYEQMYPVNTWGKDYIALPFFGRTGYVLQITAAEDATKIEINGLTVTLNAGRKIRGARSGITNIKSDKPIQVAQISQSMSCDFPIGTVDLRGPGDPFMIMLSPNEQFLNEVTFNALESPQITDYTVTVFVKTGDIDQLTLEGTVVDPDEFITVSSVPEYSYANLKIERGNDYTLKSESGFIAYIYGFGDVESFGYVAGVSLENLNLIIEGNDEQIGILAENGCINSEITFDAIFDTPTGQVPRYDTFRWDFGDGNSGTGKEFVHAYDTPGVFTVLLTASQGVGVCGSSEVIPKEITITDIEFDEIIGPVSVCPDVTGIGYSVAGSGENSYEWFVEGGTIDGASTGQNILVDWEVSRDDAWLKLLVKNSIGCAADTVQLDVRINNRLEPIAPQGEEEVCFLDIAAVPYSTPPTNGSVYEWFVEGGRFKNDVNTGSAVDVVWDGSGIGKLWYTEENPLIPECKGTSDTTFVTIYTPIESIPTIRAVLCNGASNGTIDLSLSGGKADYTVNWTNAATGFTAEGTSITGLESGTYTALIKDALQCEISRDYLVGEPDELKVDDSIILDVRCFQEANGEISLDVTGGTAPYSYHFTGVGGLSRNITTNTINSLATGDYGVVVTDANGCTTAMDFFVREPALLEADIETLINMPICPQASDGTIFIDAKGGTRAYQFFWDTAPPQEGSEATGLSRGMYNVRIVDVNGCEFIYPVEVKERFPRIYIPSAFSPNSIDEKNNVFRAVTDCNLEFSLQVFNKWGTIIFATTEITEGWDGTYIGKDVPDGTYSYKVFYTGSINQKPFAETVTGTVRVFR